MKFDEKIIGTFYSTFLKNEARLTSLVKDAADYSAKKMGSSFCEAFSKPYLYKNKLKKAA